ncbi:Mo-dependent nitrogenase C-terminal domain-containing protein [Umezakia ovalisporum]|jgi:hypothetical protein|uniref:Mo-dependent nitrogenase C-terminal domain-containing protein n=2 Tax=Umezakia ovalisporum TaxID=75695 RepID=A0AA43GVZ7_9CYAN|nr:Mo-dependent nitrogenase C-terminal domain-containing protein [Umezakia ovalisporum]MBI1241312.1 nitrogenase [Nostoc sp. RI_552]MDH6055314.1 Mo-dependent nitrogenase C-terminal domain-containing protein [Umezakia ovalisporum FSS-43]MDH6062619.1 Mo-dependent nitrogenase C-terminal domain-containing protein [Umezakia ovalisporum FSS-62]MDH6066407.1 Mo-dependent nitrogenase C-terminal domain-containing protein [Umezakia ovalisporum APH033B]MDH6071249.1 Mo-dependent nitrogenase C-terminal domai
MIKTNNQDIILPAFIKSVEVEANHPEASQNKSTKSKFHLLQPLRTRLDNLEIKNREFAHFLAKLIPAQCPFERNIILFGRKIAHIPPLCKLNPLYDQFVALRFRALCYLVDECGEDIQPYY